MLKLSSSSLRYKARPSKNEALKARIYEILRPGMGYRRAWATLRHEFAPLNPKRVHRIWKYLHLNTKSKVKRRRNGMPMPDSPTAANQLWSLDFVHDSCLNGTKFKVLVVIDEFTRECLALEAATSIKSAKVRSILALLFADRGSPKYLRSDNGPEFVAHSLTAWLAQSGTQSRFTKPGSPWQNGKVESFNGRLRAEFLNPEAFCNLLDAQVRLRLFQRFYNDERPHSSLGYETPSAYRRRSEASTVKEELYF